MGSIKSYARTGWLAMALLGVLLRGLVPAGYMPDFDAHSGVVQIKICTGASHEIIKVAADKYGKKSHPHFNYQSVPCDYAINHVFAPIADVVVLLFLIAILILAVFAPREFSFAPRRYFGAMAARAPPVCA